MAGKSNKNMAQSGAHSAVKAKIGMGGKMAGGSRRGPAAPNMGGSPAAQGGKRKRVY